MKRRTVSLIVGKMERSVTVLELRNAQEALLSGLLGKNDTNLIDAVISNYIVYGSDWQDED